MECPRCGHDNVSSFRFCEVCLAALSPGEAGDTSTADVVGRFFAEADLLEASPVVASRGTALPARFDLPWLPKGHRLGLLGRDAVVQAVADEIVAAKPTSDFDARVAQAATTSERFIRALVAEALAPAAR